MIDFKEAWARARAIAPVVVGLAIGVAVIHAFDARAVLAAMRPIGFWGFVAIIVAQIGLYAPLGLAWWMVAPGQPAARLGVFVWASLLAEAAANVLPFSQLGGAVIATRGAVLGAVRPATAFGSNVVDITIEVAAQFVFTLAGVALAARRMSVTRLGHPILLAAIAGLCVAASLVGLLAAAQRWGLPMIEVMASRLVPDAHRNAGAVARVIRGAYSRRRRILTCFGLHLAAWFVTALTAWLILGLIRRPLPLASVVAIESLVFAVRNTAIIVPGGLGVQEGAYALLGPLFGLPAEAALALSLLKRARDIVIGVPMLISWQAAEVRRSLAGRVSGADEAVRERGQMSD